MEEGLSWEVITPLLMISSAGGLRRYHFVISLKVETLLCFVPLIDKNFIEEIEKEIIVLLSNALGTCFSEC
jgi:hypothetical protein